MEGILLVILILLLIRSAGKPVNNRFHSGGIHVKPRSNSSKPKVAPAPQAGRPKQK